MFDESLQPIREGEAPKEERMNEIIESADTDQDLQSYVERLKFNPDDFVGKKMLDIGGFPNGLFATQAREKGIDITTFNPKIELFLESENANTEASNSKNVVGIAQQLPFGDKTFDAVTCLQSIPSYLAPYESEYRDSFFEIFRVLKNGGKVLMFPVLEPITKSKIFIKLMYEIQAMGGEVLYEKLGSKKIDNKEVAFYRFEIIKN